MKNWKYIEGAKTGNAGITDKEFNSENEMRRWCIEHNYTYTPVGGGYYRLEDDSGKNRKDLEAHVKAGNKKQDWDVGGNIDWDVGNFNGQWYVTKNGQKLVGPFMSMKEAERYLDGHKWELQNKYGNSKIGNTQVGNEAIAYTPEQLKRASWTTWQYIISHPEKYDDKTIAEAKRLNAQKTGNDTPWEYAHRKPKVINEDKTGAEEFFKQLSDDVKEREKKDDEEIKLVGNETYQHKLYPDKYVIIEGNNYKIVTDGKVEKSGKLTDAVLYGINQTYKRVGNFKTGKSSLKPGDRVQSYGVQGTVRKVEGENSDNIYGEPIIEVEWDNGTVKKVGEHYLRKIGNKVGNSDSDDKFAYVMREFDEGKLKTPDGKVVTDPAQAKAIAYSESKKTENGLARARKAIK